LIQNPATPISRMIQEKLELDSYSLICTVCIPSNDRENAVMPHQHR
jgi:hypothetical protein